MMTASLQILYYLLNACNSFCLSSYIKKVMVMTTKQFHYLMKANGYAAFLCCSITLPARCQQYQHFFFFAFTSGFKTYLSSSLNRINADIISFETHILITCCSRAIIAQKTATNTNLQQARWTMWLNVVMSWGPYVLLYMISVGLVV